MSKERKLYALDPKRIFQLGKVPGRGNASALKTARAMAGLIHISAVWFP
jgi:hypothetical protein